MRGFRVWCKNKNEWEQDVISLLPNGKLFDIFHNIHLNMESYIVEFDTGLTDKNGMKIFEGDQFLIDGKMYFVQFIEDRGGYVLTTGKGFDSLNCIVFNCDSIFGLEVIGNIHEVKNER